MASELGVSRPVDDTDREMLRYMASRWPDTRAALEELKSQIAAAKAERDRLAADLENCHQQDSIKTREINILVKENRELRPERDRAVAEAAQLRSALEWVRDSVPWEHVEERYWPAPAIFTWPIDGSTDCVLADTIPIAEAGARVLAAAMAWDETLFADDTPDELHAAVDAYRALLGGPQKE